MSEYEGWAIVELMGHRVRPGYVKEVEIAGGKMLRIDIPVGDGTIVTEFYGTAAIYGLRPATEAVVLGHVQRWNDPRPIRPLDFREREPLPQPEDSMDEDPDDGGPNF